MTTTYKTMGRLDTPVNDLNAAREYLREHGVGIAEYIYPDEAKPGVHSVTWDLLNEDQWEVTLIAEHTLSEHQLDMLSAWIQGQNSDGIGEGFEQQAFAEHEDDDPDDDDECDEPEFIMSSFDWQTNPCRLERVL